MNADGTMWATCNHCHDQWHISYQWHQAEDTEEGNDDKNTPDNQEQDGGIEIIEDEHFDDNPAWMDINIPKEQFLTMSEQQHFEISRLSLLNWDEKPAMSIIRKTST